MLSGWWVICILNGSVQGLEGKKCMGISGEESCDSGLSFL